jgi:peptidoglycan/xylan/chitin deacetylase (PgdA/CDA1 family)
MWDTGGDDWNSNGSHTAEKIFSAAHHGSIICLHDGRGLLPRPNIKSTLDALNILIPALLNRGLQFRSLAALLRISADPTKA